MMKRKVKIIVGLIVVIILSIIILSRCGNGEIKDIQNMKPFTDKPSIGKILNNYGKWEINKSIVESIKLECVQYEGAVSTTSNKKVSVVINGYYNTENSKLQDIEYEIDNNSVNPVQFLKFLYNVNVKDITIENVNAIYPFSTSESTFNDFRQEAGYKEQNSNTNSSANEASKTTSINLEKYATEVSDENKINNPNSLKLIENVSLRSDDILMQADFLETKYNGRALKDIFSVINNLKVIKGSKEEDGFFIFVEGNINKVPVSLRLKYQGNSILLYDSDIDNNEAMRISCEKLKEVLFNS